MRWNYQRSKWAVLSAVALAVLATDRAATGADVKWQSGSAQIARIDRANLAPAVANLAARADARHVVVQFDEAVMPTLRKELKKAGLNLLRPLGDNAYFASFSERGVNTAALGAMPSLRGIEEIELAWKTHPRVLVRDVPEWAVVNADDSDNPTVAIYALFHPDVPLATTARGVARAHQAVVQSEIKSINGLVVELPLENLDAFTSRDEVQWVEWPLPPLSAVNDSNRVITEVDVVAAPPYNLDGTGVTALIFDSGQVRATHVDYENRMTIGASDTAGVSDHSTHVACTVGGGGVANSARTGMAPGVDLVSYGFEQPGGLSAGFLYTDPGDLEADYTEAINLYGVDLSNNSIGSNVESNGFDCAWQGDYGATGALIDAIVGGSLGSPFRIIWANGNERGGSRCDVEGYGDYYSVPPPAGAKNHITVGALNSNDDSMTYFSSWGPVDDGRMKPDVSGPGCQSGGDGGVTSCSSSGDTAYTTMCGTSMAAPTVTGMLSLLLQDFRAQFPTEPDPRNSTFKILLAHTAVDLGNTGPDYQSGYGSVRVQQAIDFMRTENFLEDSVDQSGTFSALVVVDPGDPELKVTLAWDDVPGTPNVDPALVNDLDLRVFDPSMQQHYPWTLDPFNPSAAAVQTQANDLDNLEQVLVNSPAAGVWRVEVHGLSVPQGPQSFSLCASPAMVKCSSAGTVALDSSQYGCSDTTEIQVVDCDLNTSDTVIDTVTVTIASNSEPGGESVLLAETGAATADFRGTIALDTTNSAGVLLVAEGDTITATYIDADDGQGGNNVPVTAIATVDCTGPAISNVQIPVIGSDNATVTFDTNESATGTVRYGLSCGSLTGAESEAGADTSHSVGLTGLSDGMLYFFAVDAVDQQGNPTTDDNGGACYSFSTLGVAYSFPMDTDPGWTTQGLWAWGQPTGGGGQYGGPDPTSGFTGANVYGYNLSGDYENSLSETHLTSAAIDCTGLSFVTLKFSRWLGVEQPTYDHAYVRVSNNGSTWTTLWQNTAEVADSAWSVQEFDISAIADNQSTVYLRWTIGTTDGSWQYCGWNIDDVEIIATGGGGPTCSDGVLNQGEDRIDCGGPCPACDCLSDGACDDTLYCNGAETCDAYGLCQNGTAPDCNDSVSCTDDSCNEGTDSCDNVANDANCDNSLYCDGVETCDALLNCQSGTAVDCSDGVGCTDDSCNEGTDSCDNVANNANCDNGQWCDGAEWCDAVLDCQSGTAVDCNDSVGCTDDSCNEGTDSCDNVANDANCDNGLWCDGAEWCDAALDCQSGTAPDCNDGVGCTDDSCNEGTDSCDNVANDTNCDNGLWCDGAETCNATLDCQAGSDPCPGQLCDEVGDFCYDCAGDLDCADGVYCNGAEICVGGSCQAGTAVDCNDGVACTDDSCNEGTDSCDNVANDANCDNGLYCDGAETCNATLDCQAGTAVDCSDGVGCTDDSCNEGTDSCDNVPNDGLCDNGLYCDGAETCHATLDCQAGTAVDCSDSVGCTDDSCNEVTDSCDNVTNDANCDDGQFCDGVEWCDAVLDCQAGTDPCPGEGCDEVGDVCVPLTCNDNLVCESGEDCNNCPGDCISGGGGTSCGDGICQPAAGEDCLSCASDCRGKQKGNRNDYCCGDGDGNNPIGCDDGRCTTDPWMCSDAPADPYCCGDLVCEGDEDLANCAIDCGCSVPADCDDFVACTDDDCVGGACVNTPNDAYCPDDGAFCNGAEYCDGAADCSSTGDPCGPTETCNEVTDTCDPSSCLPKGDSCDPADDQCCNVCHPIKLTCK